MAILTTPALLRWIGWLGLLAIVRNTLLASQCRSFSTFGLEPLTIVKEVSALGVDLSSVQRVIFPHVEGEREMGYHAAVAHGPPKTGGSGLALLCRLFRNRCYASALARTPATGRQLGFPLRRPVAGRLAPQSRQAP